MRFHYRDTSGVHHPSTNYSASLQNLEYQLEPSRRQLAQILRALGKDDHFITRDLSVANIHGKRMADPPYRLITDGDESGLDGADLVCVVRRDAKTAIGRRDGDKRGIRVVRAVLRAHNADTQRHRYAPIFAARSRTSSMVPA